MHVSKLIVSLSLFSLSTLNAQNVEFVKSNFPNNKEEFYAAEKKLETGRDFFKQGRREFDEYRKMYYMTHKFIPVSHHDYDKAGYNTMKNAVSLLTEANRFNPKNAKLNYMLGFISFMSEPAGKETLHYLQEAYDLGASTETDVTYWLAWCYHLSGNWEEAEKYYNIHLKFLEIRAKGNAMFIEDVRKKLDECAVGKKLSASPLRVFVDNLGPNINSPFPEYGPSITADEETIFFTSRRPGSVGGKKDVSDNLHFEDIYTSVKSQNKWQAAKQLSKNVNTEGHDAVSGLSPDGSRLYVFRSTEADGGDLYESVLFGLDWEHPEKMNKNINTKYHESSVSLSFDGKHLYFISEKESGIGDRDIYCSDIDVNGEWGPSKNLGPEINTKYSEEAVFMHPDGKTMYFSSKGPGTMGGYDIFKSSFDGFKWSKPENLGFPINGPDDDVFYVVGGSGNRAYFASAKPGGYGDYDIYKITFLGPEKSPMLNSQDQLIAAISKPVSDMRAQNAIELTSAKLTILKGVVSDEKTEKPLESTIELVDNEKSTLLASFKSNSSTGKYLVTLPSGKNYGVAVKCSGYLFHSENFDLPLAAEFQEFNLDIALKKIEVGNTVTLKNIFFDFAKSGLRPESETELNRLITLLKENPGLKIEIGSHTDNIGSTESNDKLSNTRSQTVVDYLIGKGIGSSRLVAKGYGETRPKDNNETDAGRQNNRRTEFKILAK